MLFLIVSVGLSSDLLQLMMGSVEPDLTLCLPLVSPAAASGSRNSSSNALAGTPAKSPSQSLRLGLSRLAPVKRLHPSATSSQVR